MELRDRTGALWRQRVLVVLVLLAGAVLLLAAAQLAPRTYAATAVVAVRPDPAVAVGDGPELRRSLAALATSRSTLAEVADRLEARRGVDELRRSTVARTPDGTVLLVVTARDADPRVAADVANTVVDVLPDLDAAGSFLLTPTEPARPPTTAERPHLGWVLGAGGTAVVLLALVAGLARDRRTHTVDGGPAVEDATSAPLLAHLAPPTDPTALPALQPGTAQGDTFRRLALGIAAELARHPSQRVVVAGVAGIGSPVGDVVEWVGCNSAIALSDLGRRVLLVDGRLDEGEGGEQGIRDVLDGVPLEDVLEPGPSVRLQVLPAGTGGRAAPTASAATAGRLPGTRVVEVLDRAGREADLTVVVAPGLQASDDARLLAAGAALLLVVPAGRLRGTALRAHADRLRATGVRLVGVVLVRQRPERVIGE